MNYHRYTLHIPRTLYDRLTAHLQGKVMPTGKRLSLIDWLLTAIVEKLDREERR